MMKMKGRKEGGETNLPYREFQVNYIDILSSRMWNLTPHFLKCWLCLITYFQRIQYRKRGESNFIAKKLGKHCLAKIK